MAAAAPLVSVLMPSLNQARFIDAAVESVLAGQGETALELVVADGGSTDGTLERLRALTERFGPERLHWVSEPDAGPADAVNKALARARGEIIGWLNADDLYTPGAVGHAQRELLSHPDWLMFYGEGEHIDASGEPLGRYPTRPPEVGIDAFQDGCFICQPTVFLRREVFRPPGGADPGSVVGLDTGLDIGLKTAFDFELWLRIFSRFPGRIGHTQRVQASSRLHAQGITARLRQQVAAEGVAVLARHLGHARPHWLRTWRDELLRGYFESAALTAADGVELRARLLAQVEALSACFSARDLLALRTEFAADMRLKLAATGAASNADADGWVSQRFELRLADLRERSAALWLRGVHQWPRFEPLQLTIETSWGAPGSRKLLAPGPFELRLPYPATVWHQPAWVRVSCDRTFSPAALIPGSTDTRPLAWRLLSLRYEPT
jgi:hypothetical protein